MVVVGVMEYMVQRRAMGRVFWYMLVLMVDDDWLYRGVVGIYKAYS